MNASAVHQRPPTEALVNWPRLHALMEAHDADVLVAGTAPNVTYLSDYWSMSQWIRPTVQAFAVARRGAQRDVHVIAPAGNSDLVGRPEATPPTRLSVAGRFNCTDGSTVNLVDDESARFSRALTAAASTRSVEDLLIEELAALGPVTVAVETGGFTAEQHAALRSSLPDARFTDAAPILTGTRAIKTPREIDLLRQAARITENAIHTALGRMNHGWTERGLQRAYLAELVAHDALPLFTALNTGPRSALPNGQATDRTPVRGDLVRFDGGCRYGLYASDIARMAVVGTPTVKQRRYYAAVVAGLEAAIAAAGPGVRAADCFRAAVTTVRKAGIEDYDRHHCGHGIGIDNYDQPSVTATSTDVLEPGMVICLETPYYELGWGGVQAEDTLLITETGVERFTHQPSDLMEIG